MPSKSGAGIAVIVVALAGAYWNILFRGESLVSSANYHPFDYRFDVVTPAGTPTPAFRNWHDQGGAWWQWEPAGQFFSRAFRAASLPLWDPSIAGGVNGHVGLTQTQYFPPYMALLLAGDTPWQRDVYYLLLLALSGVCSFFIAYRRDFHWLSSAAMGVTFMLGGSLTATVNSMVGQAFAMLPVMVLAIDWFLDRPSWARTGIAAVLIALASLSSFLPVVISGYVLIALLAATRRSLVRFTVVMVLALGIMAFLLLPVELASSEDPAFQSWYARVGLVSYPFDIIFTLVSPTLTFRVLPESDPQLFVPAVASPGYFFYAGLIPLLLATLLWNGETHRQKTLTVFFALASAFMFLKLMGIAPIGWIGYLPIFRSLHFIQYFCGALSLGIAGLAGIGVEHLVRRRPSWTRVIAITVVALVFFALLARFASTHAIVPGASMQPFYSECTRLACFAAGLLIVVLVRRLGVSGTVAGALALALIVLELTTMAYHRRFQRADVWNNPPAYVRFLQQDRELFRVHGVHDLALTPNVAQGLGLSGLSSRASFNSWRYSTLIRRYFEAADTPFPIARTLLPKSRGILDLLNVKYLIAFQPDAAMQAAGLDAAHIDGSFIVYRNPRCWPRAYIASRYEIASSPAAALEAIAHLTTPDSVILEEPVPGAGPGQINHIQYQPNRVRIDATTAQPSILVLHDNYAPGWTVRVNNQRARLLHANCAFRAVAIPAGRSQVEFTYHPPGLTLGLWISALAVAISLGLIAVTTTSPTQNGSTTLPTRAGNTRNTPAATP